MPLRCLIVDDNTHFLKAVRELLDQGELTIVGEATNAADAVQRTRELAPDVVLLDIDLGEESGFAVARELSERAPGPAPKIVLISAHPEEDFADLIAESHALGFVAKYELSAGAIVELVGGEDGRPGGRPRTEPG